MASFDLFYDSDDDVLEADFGAEETPSDRTIPLNDLVIITVDWTLRKLLRITFNSYSQLLRVSETQLAGLEELTEQQANLIMSLFAVYPGKAFLDVTHPELLTARVCLPCTEQLFPFFGLT